jgi:hypothetical protein
MLITFKCNGCGNKITKYFKRVEDIPSFLLCGECGIGTLERQLLPPSNKSTQEIDNGLQAKKIEISNSVVDKESERLGNE